jgi:hypothetical protein
MPLNQAWALSKSLTSIFQLILVRFRVETAFSTIARYFHKNKQLFDGQTAGLNPPYKAIFWHAQHRVLRNGNKTVAFR